MQVILNIPDPQDLTALLPILKRLGISIQASAPDIKKQKRISAKKLAQLQAIVAKGGDASYFGDAAEWQRNERKDRDLPFRSVQE